uniref:Uncharacterized protein n=1 Tax=Sinocyclocheilus rhinocerous TaxID=307959 RepID=A0A673HFC3_9TELE
PLVTLFAFIDDPKRTGPWNLNNPVKASRSHQELHKELLLILSWRL